MDARDIRDIKDPIGFPSVLLPVFLFLLWLCLVAGVVFLIRCLMKRKKTRVLRLLPHEIAYARLEELKNKKLIDKNKIKEFYIKLSDIIRHYLEARFALKAPEMTTEEFLAKLRQTEILTREHKKLLKEFLIHCDLVKFAKYGPMLSEIDSSFNSAKKLVDQTKKEETGKKREAGDF